MQIMKGRLTVDNIALVNFMKKNIGIYPDVFLWFYIVFHKKNLVFPEVLNIIRKTFLGIKMCCFF